MSASSAKVNSHGRDAYYLPSDYRANPVVATREDSRGAVYWNSRRIKKARYYQYGVYRLAANMVQREEYKSILDVGCGVGLKLAQLHERLPDVDIIGVDQTVPIEYCRSHYSFGTWIADDLENPCTSSEGISADVVISADVIEHLENPDFLLDYVRQRIAPGGIAILSTPARDVLHGAQRREPGQPYHVREWTQDEFASYLHSRGFRILAHRLSAPVRVGLNLLWVSEWLNQVLRRRPFRYNQVVVARPE